MTATNESEYNGIEKSLLKKGTEWEDWDEVETGVMCFVGCQMQPTICYALGLELDKKYVLFVNSHQSLFSVCDPSDGNEIGMGRLQIAPIEMVRSPNSSH